MAPATKANGAMACLTTGLRHCLTAPATKATFATAVYHGRGVNTSADGRSRYEGDWRNDKAHGHGVNTSAGGGRYEGNWRNGEGHGHGVYTHTDGRRYDGEWRNDKPHGYGVVTFADGFRYEGNWRNGEPHGDGVLTFADGSTMSLGDSDGVAEDLHTGDR